MIAATREMFYAGTLAGQRPWLEVSGAGSLRIHAEQTGMGRGAWQQVLTLAERNGTIRPAGYTLRQSDRLTGEASVSDWNMLSGNWTLDVNAPDAAARRPSGRQAAPASLAEWTPQETPGHCDPGAAE